MFHYCSHCALLERCTVNVHVAHESNNSWVSIYITLSSLSAELHVLHAFGISPIWNSDIRCPFMARLNFWEQENCWKSNLAAPELLRVRNSQVSNALWAAVLKGVGGVKTDLYIGHSGRHNSQLVMIHNKSGYHKCALINGHKMCPTQVLLMMMKW